MHETTKLWWYGICIFQNYIYGLIVQIWVKSIYFIKVLCAMVSVFTIILWLIRPLLPLLSSLGPGNKVSKRFELEWHGRDGVGWICKLLILLRQACIFPTIIYCHKIMRTHRVDTNIRGAVKFRHISFFLCSILHSCLMMCIKPDIPAKVRIWSETVGKVRGYRSSRLFKNVVDLLSSLLWFFTPPPTLHVPQTHLLVTIVLLSVVVAKELFLNADLLKTTLLNLCCISGTLFEFFSLHFKRLPTNIYPCKRTHLVSFSYPQTVYNQQRCGSYWKVMTLAGHSLSMLLIFFPQW